MLFEPEYSEFAVRYERGEPQILWHSLVADLETPVGIFLKLSAGKANSFLLESVHHGKNQTQQRARYSIIGTRPDLIWRCLGERAELNRSARWDAEGFAPMEERPLAALRQVLAESELDIPGHLPPMSAGLFGYFGYDMIRQVEHLPDIPEDRLGLHDAVLMRPSVIAVFDNVVDKITLTTPIWPKEGVSARAAYAQAAERLSDAVGDLGRAPLLYEAPAASTTGEPAPAQSNMSQQDYFTMVETAKQHIIDGDIFQVVLSQRWRQRLDTHPFTFYRALRRVNPSPYMFYFHMGDFQIVGASPEILVQTTDRKVTIRPIAGTRPRGADAAADKVNEESLLADHKEIAEHLMLLDLGRNDVGRVARIGTVTPTARFTVEYYSHVMHIVSNVEGELKEGFDAVDALLAGLPAGTVSGAPKIRAMEIIDALEPEKRGVYGGGVGYFSAGGDMDMCIALRTALIKDGTMIVQAGGGIVHDSTPQYEYNETIAKSRALFRAAEESARLEKPSNR